MAAPESQFKFPDLSPKERQTAYVHRRGRDADIVGVYPETAVMAARGSHQLLLLTAALARESRLWYV
ncbi:hypothetical protein N7516_008372 [Penicillium verrucosum]|uniref:uncharacterized protein n=1 Tax=Penicillium verrucosum TaxID=60171 RepID=UPI0025457A4C|nr:uncharacterized protein N7516_008372 [Penicillium verrucosum]KAJ5926599.1 hypothetical protein N7516_008372 [Penicillium verrucosum]